jgi:hypothetical protein
MPDSDTPPVLFSDVLGAMVSSIAQARQIADVAAVNLAYAYQRHDLLKGMAVPRLRFRSVDVSLPVLIRQVHPAKQPELNDAATIARHVAAEVQRRAKLVAQKISFEANEEVSSDRRKSLESVAALWGLVAEDRIISRLHVHVESQLKQRIMEYYAIVGTSPASISESVIRSEVAASVKSGFRLFFREILEEDAKAMETSLAMHLTKLKFSELKRTHLYGKVLTSVARLASDMCFRTPSVPAELEMVVHTDEIKNTGGMDSVTRIRFTLLEEGLEWVEDEHGGRLVIE